MATQGLVTVRSGGKVVMKIVAGCDGYQAKPLAELIMAQWPLDVNAVYDLATEVGFGVTESLVVITEQDVRFDGDEDLHPRYRDTFDQPEFNPRWKHGTADHVEVIDV